MSEFTHLDAHNRASMVDVGQKPKTSRRATARGFVCMSAKTLERVRTQHIAKGDVLQVARIAGIMAAKRTDELIPLCHSLGLEDASVRFCFLIENNTIAIEATASCFGKTGVEMEAMVAVSVAAMTIYDMCKALDRGVQITDMHLYSKSGGRSGDYSNPKPPGPPIDPLHEWL